jgi:hypothetical protein
LQPEVLQLARSHIAISTQTAYAKGERYFLRFLGILYGADVDVQAATVRIAQQLAAPEDRVLSAYAAFLARPDASTQERPPYSTIKQYFKGVTYCLRMRGHVAPLADMPLLHLVLHGARRENGRESRPKSPITPDMLVFFLANLNRDTSSGATVAAAMLTCFFAMLRKGSVCADRSAGVSSFNGLLRRDVQVDDVAYSLVLSLRHGKTNQYHERVTVVRIAGRRGHALDPVAAFLRARELCPADEDDPAFCMVVKGRVRALMHDDFVSITKALTARMGGAAADYSGHSYRRGGATCAHAAGVDPIDIMRTGDWTSMQYLDYIWRSPEQCLVCSSSMLNGIADGSLGHLRLDAMRR